MKIFKFFRTPRNLLFMLVAALMVAEGAVRAFGLVGFPLYAANAQIGYIPAASQQGSFLNKNDWQFNALHMGAPAFKPDAARDVLLLGDSVVYGGNAFRQPERLGPALQAALQVRGGGAVWPVSAGSWALRNALAYMRLNPQVPAGVKSIVFVLNTGDFGNTASSWACELTHPRSRPTVALWYLFNKYVHAFEPCGNVPAALKVPDGDVAAELQAFMVLHGGKATFVLYPDKTEAADGALAASHFAAGEAILKAAGATQVAHVGQDKRWSVGWYKDGIHPTAAGNRVLAGIINDSLDRFSRGDVALPVVLNGKHNV
ncbi:MAG: hypothetical protein M0P52_14130 [Rhodoferax sp.]|nr:hypothetical protein [Rhodoferax sp.]